MAISDLRNKLKATPVAALEQADQDLDKALGREDRGNSEYHKMKVGRNVFRIYPPHESVDPVTGLACSFAEPKVTTFLPAMVMDRDSEGKEQKDEAGKTRMKMGSKPVFNATIHGKKNAAGQPVSKDAVEEFIRLAGVKAGVEYPDSEEKRKEYLKYIYGIFSPIPANRINGITYRAAWVSYADRIVSGAPEKFALLEVGKAVKNRWNQIAALEAGDEPLGTDPFTDIDEGRATVIIYDDKAKKADDYYTTEIDNATEEEVLEGGRKVKVQKTYPLTDDQIENLYKQPSLAKMYRNVFTRRDLDLQLWGLKEVDKKGKYGIFDTEEFQNIAETIASFYPVEEQSATEEEKGEQTSTSSEEVFETAPVHETKKFEDMNLDKAKDDYDLMNRDELKEFCKDNNTGIVIKSQALMSDNDLRNRIREWEASLNTKAPVVEEKEPATETVTETTTAEPEGIDATGTGIIEEAAVTEGPKLTAKERLELIAANRAASDTQKSE